MSNFLDNNGLLYFWQSIKNKFLRGNTGGVFYGTCSTAAGTVEKVVECADFTADNLKAGTIIIVTFTITNSGAVANLTMNVNGTGAKPIKCINNGTLENLSSAGYLKANTKYPFYYDGAYWVCWFNYSANAGSGSKEWTSLVSDTLTEETTFKKYAIDDTGLEEIFFRMVMPKTPDSTTTYPIIRAGLNANAWYNVSDWQIASSKSFAKNITYPTVIESFLEKINGLWRLKASHYAVNTETGTYSFRGLQQEPQSKISSISIDNNNNISIPVGTTVEIYGRAEW